MSAMNLQIHPSTIISSKARLGNNVSVGPYTVIGDAVVIGEGTSIGTHCNISGNTTIGKNCQVFTGAVIGSRPQDLKYKGVKSILEIGDNNIIREYCTFNPGTQDSAKTAVGSGNLFMAYSHVAHDCVVGNNCVIANNGTLAGHVSIEDQAVIGGLVAVHQFVRVGRLSIIGGCSKVVQDIPPFSTCDGHPARVYGLNLIGLRRHAIPHDSIDNLDRAFRIFFGGGLSKKSALEKVAAQIKSTPEVTYLVNFMKSSERGVAGSCRK